MKRREFLKKGAGAAACAGLSVVPIIPVVQAPSGVLSAPTVPLASGFCSWTVIQGLTGAGFWPGEKGFQRA
jgi:hypothetical protein